MSGGSLVAEGIPLTLRLSKGERNAFFNGLLAHELRKSGLAVEQQRGIEVSYDGVLVGEYVADLLVENAVVVELKAAKVIDQIHLAQCLNYLKATGLRVGLLINFGPPRVEIERVVNGF